MTRGRSLVLTVKMTVRDPVEGHRAGPRRQYGNDDQQEQPPAWPAMSGTSRQRHRGEREWERKSRVRQLDEMAPLNEFRKHRARLFFYPGFIPHLPPASVARGGFRFRGDRARARP